MKTFLVTVRIAKHLGHDPKNKVTGTCPVDQRTWCDDVTGEHHTLLHTTRDDNSTVESVRAEYAREWHVTRVEDVTATLHVR